jgi:hypothetical protein
MPRYGPISRPRLIQALHRAGAGSERDALTLSRPLVYFSQMGRRAGA